MKILVAYDASKSANTALMSLGNFRADTEAKIFRTLEPPPHWLTKKLDPERLRNATEGADNKLKAEVEVGLDTYRKKFPQAKVEIGFASGKRTSESDGG